jgi:hypothetical protein
MKLLYKILFEVKILHEYYLTNPDQTSVFQDAKQADRLTWLSNRFAKDQPVLSDDVQFQLPSCMTRLFKNQKMILLKSFSGFQVAIQVNEIPQSGGTFEYAPAVPLPANCNMLILVRQQVGQFGRLTNSRMQRPVQSLYYFSNEKLTTPKTAPVLSTAISAQSSTYTYEQGELSANGSTIDTCYYAGTTPTFTPVAGNGFANENDRLIVGPDFEYTFQASDGVTTAQFTLKDASGNTIRTIPAAATDLLDSVELDFSDLVYASPPGLVTLPKAKASDPLLYTLEVTGNNSYARTLNLIFYENPAELYSAWALIQFQVSVSNPEFNLLDANGYLITTPALPTPDAAATNYPIFEIRCKSRYTFWRYYPASPNETLNAPGAALSPFLQTSTQSLTTITPVPATYLPYFFSTDPTATTPSWTYLPNPDPATIIEVDSNQLFSNIWVPESTLFPVTLTT